MKIWSTVSWTGAGTSDDPRRPDISGVSYAVLEVPHTSPETGTYCLVKAAGLPGDVSALTSIDDQQAIALMTPVNPSLTWSSLEVADPELESIGDTLGVDVKEVRNRASGNLSYREWEVVRALANKKGVDVSQYEWDVKQGKCVQFESALKLLR